MFDKLPLITSTIKKISCLSISLYCSKSPSLWNSPFLDMIHLISLKLLMFEQVAGWKRMNSPNTYIIYKNAAHRDPYIKYSTVPFSIIMLKLDFYFNLFIWYVFCNYRSALQEDYKGVSITLSSPQVDQFDL